MRSILRRLAAGELTEAEAEAELRRVQLGELDGRAQLDLGRPARRGLPEVVLAEGKAPAEAGRLAVRLAEEQGQGLVSRMGPEHRAELGRAAAAAGLEVQSFGARAARVLRPGFKPEPVAGRVALVTAGTSDLDCADEALAVVEACGLEWRRVADVGVAGLHRLLAPLAELLDWDPDVIVVAAGMDGVLPGVVAGLVDRPVIGLPVPTGYGAGGEGEAALLTMLQSCATGLAVVNIDNGVGAGAAAVLIAARAARRGAGAAGSSPARPAPKRPRSEAPARRS
ncbi:MAG: nickel pincer cofactor biosynthesis protein LarB [Candidatus Dormibacteraeota bacterium]|nr:nickel pincer cofactor biosynthesis protein LarB [Candidatus Dormibacteraeota bacterium]